MKLGEGVEQAIHSVALLSSLPPSTVLPARAIAKFYGASPSYLLKHLQAMSSAGILASTPGPKGGYCLAKSPDQISLLDIVLAVEGSSPAFRCAEIRRRGPNPLASSFYRAPCRIATAMLQAERVYRAELQRITLADIIFARADQDEMANTARSCAFLELNQRNAV